MTFRVTLLGTAGTIGVPAPLCDCEYCEEAPQRYRSALLVEVADTALVFDIGPDIHHQLRESNVTEPDGFFVTHAHFDHYYGIHELVHAASEPHRFNGEHYDDATYPKEVPVYGSDEVLSYTKDKFGFLLDRVDYRVCNPHDQITYEDESGAPLVTVESFPIEHGPMPTQGYTIIHPETETKIVYAPDLQAFGDESETYKNADFLFVDSSVFGAEIHGRNGEVAAAVESANADRVVLLTVSEHVEELHTEELVSTAREAGGYEVWNDFDTVTFPPDTDS